MQYSTLLCALLSTLALAAPAPQFPKKFNAAEGIAAAAAAWMQDTMTVSSFLDNSTTNLKTATVKSQALVAFNAENDELNHKGVLDKAFLNVKNPSAAIVNANKVLVTQGTFQFVVDGLKNISTNADVSIVDAINKDRCGSVLPAIDAYFKAAAAATGGAVTFAIRPIACQGAGAATAGQATAAQGNAAQAGGAKGKGKAGN